MTTKGHGTFLRTDSDNHPPAPATDIVEAAEITGTAATPSSGNRGLVARSDGWHDIDDSGTEGAAFGATTGGTPANTFDTTGAEGSSGEFLQTDDQLPLFDATAPVTQAMGDSAATGSAGKAARRDHKHGMPALGTTAAAIGTSAGGSATTVSKSDHVHATGAGTPSTQAFGDAAATGSGPAAAMTDHKHAMPADPTGRALGLTGATAATRYVGGTTSGAPASGTFLKGDFVIGQDASVWICTTAGSPGTWTELSGGGGSGPPLSDADPEDVTSGSASAGTSADASRADHVHHSSGGGTTSPSFVQSKTVDLNNSNGDLVFDATPSAGSILFIAIGDIGAFWDGSNSLPQAWVSGGGASWIPVPPSPMGGKWGTGNPAMVGLWMGLVGASPSATVSIVRNNYAVAAGIEISGLDGAILSSISNGNPSGTWISPVLNLDAVMAALSASLLVYAYSNRATSATGPSNCTDVSIESSSGLYKSVHLGYKIGASPASDGSFTGSTDNQTVVAALLR